MSEKNRPVVVHSAEPGRGIAKILQPLEAQGFLCFEAESRLGVETSLRRYAKRAHRGDLWCIFIQEERIRLLLAKRAQVSDCRNFAVERGAQLGQGCRIVLVVRESQYQLSHLSTIPYQSLINLQQVFLKFLELRIPSLE